MRCTTWASSRCLAAGVVTAQTVRARYGPDTVFVREARLPIKDLPTVARIEQLAGAIPLTTRTPRIRPASANTCCRFDPKARSSSRALRMLDLAKPKPLTDYRLRVTTERAAISTLWHHVPLTKVVSDLLVTPALIDITKFNADVLTGKLATSGRIELAGDVPTYTGRVRVRRVDLNQLAEFFVDPGEPPITVSGELSSDFTVSGRSFDEDAALRRAASGRCARDRPGRSVPRAGARDGRRAVHLGSAGRVGEAATAFKIANRRIHLTDAAVGAPAIGVRGSGDIAFDGSLDLELIATGLNDWEKHIRQDDNPVANVAGAIAGTVQKGLNTVTKELLYRMKVDGTVDKPVVRVVAAPVLQK